MADVDTRELQQRVRQFLSLGRQPSDSNGIRQSAAELLARTIDRGWRTYLVGGFLRDLIFSHRDTQPRDFDIIVQDCSRGDLREAFADIISGENRFGGLRLRQRAPKRGWIDFDVWRLEDTWAVRKLDLPKTIQAFVQTPFLNLDSVAISISPGSDYLSVFENGFFEAFTKRSVEINHADNPFPVLCAARGLGMAAGLGFQVGPKLSSFVYHLAESVRPEEFVAEQIGHYGNPRFTQTQLTGWIFSIRTQLEAGSDHVDLRNVSPPNHVLNNG